LKKRTPQTGFESKTQRGAAVRSDYKLDDLLKGMTPEAMHEAFDWGPERGREIVEE
jgi:antitoxin component of MazEF toxin-antitoxin module